MISLKKHEQGIRDALQRWVSRLGFDEAMTTAIANAVYASRQEVLDILSGGAGRPADHEAFVPTFKSEKTLGKFTGPKK